MAPVPFGFVLVRVRLAFDVYSQRTGSSLIQKK